MRWHTRLRAVIAALLLLAGFGARAEGLLMVRSPHEFPEAMLALQTAIAEHGYVVSRVQRVDIGLTGSGFETDKYRVVFFGKIAEIRDLSTRFPQLIPYLPLHMTIFAEADDTLVVMEDPVRLEGLVDDAEVAYLFRRWRNDVLSMFDELDGARR